MSLAASYFHRSQSFFAIVTPISTVQRPMSQEKECELSSGGVFLSDLGGGGGGGNGGSGAPRRFVFARVSTDRRGYCPGDTVYLRGLLHNVSTSVVRPEVSLCQVQTYTTFDSGEEQPRRPHGGLGECKVLVYLLISSKSKK